MIPEHPKNTDEAIAIAKTGWWKGEDPRQIVAFQLYEDLLCMDFGDYHEATEKALGRPVWTHEFARPQDLRDEFELKKPPRNQDDVIRLAEEMVGKARVVVIKP